MKGIKAEQFNPADENYIEHAWCAGPMDFRHASHRGHGTLSNRDWIITFLETGEHIAVMDATYQAYFAEPPVASIVSKYLSAPSQLPAQETSPATLAEADSEDWGPACAGAVAGENSELGEPADGEGNSSSAELDAPEPLDAGLGTSIEDSRPARNKRRN